MGFTPRLSPSSSPKGKSFEKRNPFSLLTFSLPDHAREAWSPFVALFLGSFSRCFSYHPDSLLTGTRCRWSSFPDPRLYPQVSITRSRQTLVLLEPSLYKYLEGNPGMVRAPTSQGSRLMTPSPVKLIVCFVGDFDTGLDCYHSQYSIHRRNGCIKLMLNSIWIARDLKS